MKIMHSGIVAAIAISTVAMPTQASEATEKAALKRIYVTMDALAKRGDVAKISSYLTADYKQRLIGGQTMGKEQSMQMLKMGVQSGQMKFLPTKITSMRVSGNRATVEAIGGGTMSQADPQGKAHKMVILAKTRDQWTKVGGVWKERASDQLTQEIRMDGRVISKQ